MTARKLFHASGIVIVLLYRGLDLSRPFTAWLLFALTAVLGLLDLVRARFPAVQERFSVWFGPLLDPKDRGLNGSTIYFFGCTLSVAIFPADAACGGILSLALGDSLAALVGSSVRSPRWGRVSLAGSTACLVAATGVCLIFFPWPRALLGGVAAMVIEACSGSKLDNLAIPVGVALVLAL